MADGRDNEPNEQKSEGQTPAGGINRRTFLGTLGAATAAAAFLGRGDPARAQSPTYWFYDSFGNVIPVDADAIAAGIYPPPLPSGVTIGPDGPVGAPPSSGSTYVTNGYAQPNILLLMVDQMRLPRWLTSTQRTTLFSSIMPNLYGTSDSLISTATSYPNYFVAAVACTPSRSTLLTGLYPQQTCMFATEDTAAAPALQPYDGGNGFATIGDVLSQQLTNSGMQMLNIYDTAWIGKWHVSDLEFGTGSNPTGANGPLDYGFSSPFNLPTNAHSSPFPNHYPSPNGLQNESTAGDNLTGRLLGFTYNVAAGDPLDVNAGGLDIGPPSGFHLSDAAIYHAFHNYWLPNHASASVPWFLGLSFIGPHDMQSFPWAFGLASNADGQACGISPNTYNCALDGGTSGFYPPPVLGWTDNYVASSPINFAGLNIFYSPPNDWNNTESPATSHYGQAGGKPGLQAYFQNQINLASGDINSLTGWNTFLNYYYWLHGSFDTLVGLVLKDLSTGVSPYPVIIFTSDHGDFGGSHTLHAKEGALYDEAFNVPLIIHANGQMSATQRSFTCSSVDILPFIYSLALGNESWRTDPSSIVSYLNNRESIFDSIMHENADSRRLAPYTNVGGFNHTGAELPYVLFSTDEYSYATDPSDGTVVPSHAIAFRTVDKSVVHQDANTGMNFCGGGKLGMYTTWLNCTTFPNVNAPAPFAPQFEFYDYYAPGINYGELGNDAFNSGWKWNGATAGVYLNSYNEIMADELYLIDPKFQLGFNTAFTAYMNYIGSNGGGASCPIEVGPPDTIPWP